MKLKISGKHPLKGEVTISGAKNSALPLLSSSIIIDELELSNIPFVKDIYSMIELLTDMGVKVNINENEKKVYLNAKGIYKNEAPYEYVKKMRASILVLGPLLAKYGEAQVAHPGGCNIGPRPVDLHIKALKEMGAEISIEHGIIKAKAKKLHGAEINFEKVTVTGTENIMMAAVLAEGETIINNSAKEPEVVDLAKALKKAGAEIYGEGTDQIIVKGKTSLNPIHHSIIPDRIEAGTYFLIGALLGENKITINSIIPEHIKSILKKGYEIGIKYNLYENKIEVFKAEELNPIIVETAPYPGFPTDMQAQFVALLTQANGNSIVKDTIFPARFLYVDELLRMGAEIKKIAEGEVIVSGKKELSGTEVNATDLRASASLVIAGLIADGETIINDIEHLERGYEDLVLKIKNLNGKIEYIGGENE